MSPFYVRIEFYVILNLIKILAVHIVQYSLKINKTDIKALSYVGIDIVRTFYI